MDKVGMPGLRVCFAVIISTAPFGMACCMEKASPMIPGGSTGVAAGALPPKGLYFGTGLTLETGKLRDDSGSTARTPGGATVKITNFDVVASLLWVPGWKMLGATYGASIKQPYQWQSTDLGGASNNGIPTSSKGLFNTIVTPITLSWDLGNGFFLASGLTVYVKNGHFLHHYSAEEGREVVSTSSYANNFWTFEPNFAVSYLKDGWNFTLNSAVDINTKNKTTNYKSGSVYYLDATATKTSGAWTYGAIGNFTKQFKSDKIGGAVVEEVPGLYARGKKIQWALIGPMLSYDFGKAALTARYLYNVHTRNDADHSFFHVGISIPLH